jgi:hypothetical protein
MLTGVRGSGTARDGVLYGMSYDYRRFFVDGDGILRDRGKDHGRFRRSSHAGPSGKEVRAKVGDRKVIDYGVVQYWAEPASRMWVPCKRPGQCSRRHRTVDVTPEGLIKFYAGSESHRTFLGSNCFRTILHQHLSIGSWRQGKRFTPEEAVWWSTVSLLIRESVINSE